MDVGAPQSNHTVKNVFTHSAEMVRVSEVLNLVSSIKLQGIAVIVHSDTESLAK